MAAETADTLTSGRPMTGVVAATPAVRDGRVTVRLDTASVRRSGTILMALVASLLLGLWLFSVTRHFLFLVLLAWMFAVALEPGIKWLIGHGRSRGTAAAIMGGGAIVVALLLSAIFGKLFFTQIAALVSDIPSVEKSLITWVNAHFHTHWDVASISSSLNLSSSNVASWAGKLSGGVLGVVGSLAAVLFDLLTVVVFAFYFAGDGPNFMRAWRPGCRRARRRSSSTSPRSPSPRPAGTSPRRSSLPRCLRSSTASSAAAVAVANVVVDRVVLRPTLPGDRADNA